MTNRLKKLIVDCGEKNRVRTGGENWVQVPAFTRVTSYSASSDLARPVWRETVPKFIFPSEIKEFTF
jgi:hypothetical protein